MTKKVRASAIEVPTDDDRRWKELQQAIADGDADLIAGRFKTYKPGELTTDLRDASTKKTD